MERPSRAIWFLVDGGESILSLAEGRYLGPGFCGCPRGGRCRRPTELGNALCGRHHRASTPARCGCKKGDPDTEALGRSRGGFSTKVHMRAEGNGKPMVITLTPGQRHETTAFEAIMEGGGVKRAGPGRPKLRPRRVVGDKGYSSNEIRLYLRRKGIRITIPRRTNERRTGPFDRAIYRNRNLVERLFGRLKQYRRLATRYEKRAENYRAMWVIASIVLWL